MKIQSLPVGDSFKALDVRTENLLARAEPNAHSGLANIVVRAGGRESLLKSAAEACVLERGPRGVDDQGLGGDLRFVRLQGEVVLVLGVFDVFTVDLRTSNAFVALHRFRSELDDHGFYNEQLLELPDGCVLIYEGGVARVTADGKSRWHAPITWNDQLDRLEGEALYFVRGESDGSISRWSLDLRDGSRH